MTERKTGKQKTKEANNMSSVLSSMIVTVLFFVIAIVVGFRLERSPKPYRLALLSAHIVLFVLIAGGIVACLYKINGVSGNKFFSTLSLYLAALPLVTSLVTGAIMVIIKQKNLGLILGHKVSMFFMAISVVAGVVFMIGKV
jgi:uncharacterized PurR-regulated membrane protein YhhQ (DUF165 family)